MPTQCLVWSARKGTIGEDAAKLTNLRSVHRSRAGYYIKKKYHGPPLGGKHPLRIFLRARASKVHPALDRLAYAEFLTECVELD